MSHRNRPRSQRRNAGLALPVVVFGVILIAVAAFLFTRQRDTDGTPALAVDTQRIEYGSVKFGETRSFEIKVTNTGDGILRFKESPYIEVLEGC